MTDLMLGWKEIAAYLRVSDRTARRYKTLYGLPVCYMPSGTPAITPGMVEKWLLKSMEIQTNRRKRQNNKPS